MKQFEILSGRCLVVELPEGAHSPVVDDYLLGFNLPAPKWAGDWGDDSYDTIKLPLGNWRIIGMLSEVTEGQLDGLIEPIKVFDYDAHYWNYKDKEYQPIRADESLESAIEAAGYTFENKERCPQLSDYDDNCFGVTSWDDMPLEDQFQREKWKAAQSRVLCRERCLLLGREE